MAKIIVEKRYLEDGKSYNFFSCDGIGKCGGSDFKGKKQVIKCFHCEQCKSFQEKGLKIEDNRNTLDKWFK